MEAYSFSEITANTGDEYKEKINDKIKRLVTEEVEASFDFTIDLVAINAHEIFIGSNSPIARGKPSDPKLESKVYKHHLYDNITTEVGAFTHKLTHVNVVPLAKSLFLVFENLDYCLINYTTKKRILNGKFESEISNIIVQQHNSFVYFGMNQEVYRINASDSNPKIKLFMKINQEIVKLDFVNGLKDLIIHTGEQTIKFVDICTRKSYNFPYEECEGMSNFCVHADSQKIAIKFKDEIVVWKVVRSSKTVNPYEENESSEAQTKNDQNENIPIEINQNSKNKQDNIGDFDLRNETINVEPKLSEPRRSVQYPISNMVHPVDRKPILVQIKVTQDVKVDDKQRSLFNSTIKNICLLPEKETTQNDNSAHILSGEHSKNPSEINATSVNGQANFRSLQCQYRTIELKKLACISMATVNTENMQSNGIGRFVLTNKKPNPTVQKKGSLDTKIAIKSDEQTRNPLHIMIFFNENLPWRFPKTFSYKGLIYCPYSNLCLNINDDLTKMMAYNFSAKHDLNYGYDPVIYGAFLDNTQTFFFTWNRLEIKKWGFSSCEGISEWSPLKFKDYGKQIIQTQISLQHNEIVCITDTSLIILSAGDLTVIRCTPKEPGVDFQAAKLATLSNRIIAANVNKLEIRIWNLLNVVTEKFVTLTSKEKLSVLCSSEKHKICISADENGSLHVFNEQMFILQDLKKHKNQVSAFLVIDNSDELISASDDSIIFWSLPGMLFLKKIENVSHINRMLLINNEMILAHHSSSCCTYYSKNDWSLVSDEPIIDKSGGGLRFVIFSQLNNQLLYVMEELNLIVIPTRSTTTVLNTINIGENPGLKLALNSKSNGLYSLSSTDNSLTIYDCKTLQTKCFHHGIYGSQILEISEKFNIFFTVGLKSIVVGELSSLNYLDTIKMEANLIKLMVQIYSLDWIFIVPKIGNIKIHKLPDFNIVAIAYHGLPFIIDQICVNQSANIIYIAYEKGELAFWDCTLPFKPTIFGSHPTSITGIYVSEITNRLFSCSKNPVEIKIWKAREKTFLKKLNYPYHINKIIFKENLDIFLVADFHEKLTIWSLTSLHQIEIKSPFLEDCKIHDIVCFNNDHNIFMSYSNLKTDGNKIVVCDLRRLFNMTSLEKRFVKNVFLGENAHLTLTENLSKFKTIYDQSFLLKNYFSMHLAAVGKKNQAEFIDIWKEEERSTKLTSLQISALHFLLSSKQYEYIQNVITFYMRKKLILPINEKLVTYLLQNTDVLNVIFLAFNIQKVNSFSSSNSTFQKLGSFNQFTLLKLEVNEFLENEYSLLMAKSPVEKRIKIEVYDMSIKWDFTAYTSTSIIFLEAYSQSTSDEFIVSPYRHIISDKWKRSYPFFVAHTIIYWSHVLFYFLFVMNRDVLAFLLIDFTFISLLLTYEIMDIWANRKKYLSEYWNFFDLLSISICSVYLVLCYQDITYLDELWFRVFLLISLVIVTMRGFTFFKVFAELSHITYMTINMVKQSIGILIIVTYFGLCISIMMARIQTAYSFNQSVIINYNLIFGNIPELADLDILSVILVVVGSLILPIFLINFLIAKLSGTYSTLENRQRVLAYKEMASSLYEHEAIVNFVMGLFGKSVLSVVGHIYIAVDVEEISEIENSDNTNILLQELTQEQKEIAKEQRESSIKQQELAKEQRELAKEHRELLIQIKELAKEQQSQSQLLKQISSMLENQGKTQKSKNEPFLPPTSFNEKHHQTNRPTTDRRIKETAKASMPKVEPSMDFLNNL